MIARKTFLIMIAEAIGGLLGFVGLYFITNYMSVEAFGIVGFALSFVTMFGIIKTLGFESAHIKRVSEGKDLGECIGTFLFIKIIITTIFIIVVLSALFIWTNVLGRGFESQEHLIAIYILIIYGIITSFSEIMRQTFMAKREIAKIQISVFFGTLMRIVATIIIAISGKGAIELAFTYIIAETTVIVVMGILFRKFPIKRPSGALFKSYYKFALPVFIISSIAIIITNIDKVFIQLFWGAQEVGYYFAIYKLITFLILISASIGLLLFPMISELHAKNDKKQIISLVVKSERYLSMFAFPLVFFLIAFPEPIINILLDPKYYPAIPILRILPIWALLSIISRPYGPLIMGMDRPWLVTIYGVVRVLMNIVLNLLLIPIDIKILGMNGVGLGAEGAAIATLITGIFGFIYLRGVAWHLIKIKWNPTNIIKHLFAAAVMVFVLQYIISLLIITRWYHLSSVFLVGIGIYIGILYLIREFKKDDFDFIIDTINPKKMGRYVIDELKGNK